MDKMQAISSLIREYLSAVEEGVRRLNSKYSENPTFHKVKEDGDIERHGFIEPDRKTYYEFHGINGCYMKWENGRSVDFNLGTAGRCDGFDPWFVWDFYESNEDIKPKYAEVAIEVINAFILEMERSGMIIKDELHRLCYFAEDYSNPDPFRWADGKYPEDKSE